MDKAKIKEVLKAQGYGAYFFTRYGVEYANCVPLGTTRFLGSLTHLMKLNDEELLSLLQAKIDGTYHQAKHRWRKAPLLVDQAARERIEASIGAYGYVPNGQNLKTTAGAPYISMTGYRAGDRIYLGALHKLAAKSEEELHQFLDERLGEAQ